MLPQLVRPSPGVPPPGAGTLQPSGRKRHDARDAETEVAQPAGAGPHLHRHDASGPQDAPAAELQELDGVVCAPRRLGIGHTAFVQGQAFRHLHAVRAGSFKTVIVLQDGREQVSQFSFAGDLMGLDGLGCGVHASTATALEDSVVDPVPLTRLRDAAMGGKPWHQVLCCHMGQEIVREHAQVLLLASTGAFARLAIFLLDMSERMRMRGYSPLNFHLRMTRADIGSYLGLSMETVSRMFSTLQQQGVVEVDKRHIVIRSLARLRELRDGDGA
jgi:CRP/FNR family transcriptional regulator